MKWMPLCWITLTTAAMAAPESTSSLRRQVEEQERQIRQLETENARLRYMLTEMDHYVGDPLKGTRVSGGAGGAGKDTSKPGDFHTVAKGETLSAIAARKHVDLAALLELNQLRPSATIRPGQKLRLPERSLAKKDTEMPRPPIAETRSHTVRDGENLYRISLRYGIELDELLSANPSIDPRKLRIGQIVRIPEAPATLAGRD